MPEITAAQFAQFLPHMRPALIATASRMQPGSLQDAQDAVGEMTLLALNLLPRYSLDPAEEQAPYLGGAYPPSLLRWLKGILRFVGLKEHKKRSQQPSTTPMEAAEAIAAPCVTCSVRELAEPLPEKYRGLVAAWLEGESQSEIARSWGVAYNTVGNRLNMAFSLLRKEVPDAGAITYSFSDFGFCSRATIYHKPTGVWKSWTRDLPPDARIRTEIRRRRLQDRHEAGYSGRG